jgi:hypothetical protein
VHPVPVPLACRCRRGFQSFRRCACIANASYEVAAGPVRVFKSRLAPTSCVTLRPCGERDRLTPAGARLTLPAPERRTFGAGKAKWAIESCRPRPALVAPTGDGYKQAPVRRSRACGDKFRRNLLMHKHNRKVSPQPPHHPPHRAPGCWGRALLIRCRSSSTS